MEQKLSSSDEVSLKGLNVLLVMLCWYMYFGVEIVPLNIDIQLGLISILTYIALKC